MKNQLKKLLAAACKQLQSQNELPADLALDIQVERTRDKAHGDLATNLALMLAKPARSNPRELAQKIIAALPASALIEKTSVAGPGFINVTLAATARLAVIKNILEQKKVFGHSDLGKGKKVQVEFVSANPTGPLHVGHGRGAAYGATLANLLTAMGYEVECEYYVNDAGRQMDILATSVWLRYLSLCDENITFPANGYKGDYILDIAAALKTQHKQTLKHPAKTVMADLPADETAAGGDKEAHIDALIKRAKQCLGINQYKVVLDTALDNILGDIKADLEGFGVNYNRWFSEQSLVDDGTVEASISQLTANGYLYEQSGAQWFKSSDFGDEKDRVVIRENGQATYFASDIAYHANKIKRGFNKIINIWGADHHGYIPRIKGAMQAIGDDPEQLDVLLVQFANLYKNGNKMQMSTRSGDFVTLRQLREDVGCDAARYFYVMRKCEQHLDFDLDLAKSESSDNPVYYIQYAHARICRVKEQLAEQQLSWQTSDALNSLDSLTEPQEETLIASLNHYGEVVENAAKNYEPHVLAHYLRELANDFHSYYNAHKFIVEDTQVRQARLALIFATKQVLSNGLALLGVSAPQSM